MTWGAVGYSNRAQSFADSYVERLTGYFVPPYNATYTFYAAGDDWNDFSLSTNASASGLQVVSLVTGFSPFNYPWWGTASQISAARNLTGGQRYYFRMRHMEGGGLDWMRVAVRISNFPDSGVCQLCAVLLLQ